MTTDILMLGFAVGVALAFIAYLFRVWPGRREGAASLSQTETSFKKMVQESEMMTMLVSREGLVRFMNKRFGDMLGATPDAVRMTNISGHLHPQDIPPLRQALDDAMAGVPPREMTLRFKSAHGDFVATLTKISGLVEADGRVVQAVVQAVDARANTGLQIALTQSKQRFEDFAANSADWLWEVNERGRITYASPSVRQVMGYTPDDVAGMPLIDLLFDDVEDTVCELFAARLARKEPFRDLSFWGKTKLGERVFIELAGVPVFDERKIFLGFRGVASDCTASQEDRENMFRLATTDHLTGLLNRPRFKEELERAVTLAKRHSTEGMVLLIDLDRFKEINDTHGHEAGDEILVAITGMLRESVRSTDVLARLGGDEFAIIMHNIPENEARAKIEKLIERIARYALDYKGMKLTVTMSVGMVPYPQEDRGADDLLMASELAMYRAKDMGRNRLFMDTEDTGGGTKDSVRAQLKGVERLRQCLDSNDFQLYYQPIVPGRAEEVPLFECLLRIFDEEGRMLSPALYIDAAEHFGIIQRLDLAVVRRAFETQVGLKQQKLTADFSVNLSCRSLGDKVFMEQVKKLVKEIKVDPARIIFEVTETMALHDPAQMRDIDDIKDFMVELKAFGFRFALDDFGTGFTSFKYLKVLPVDLVKIDGEYIKDLVDVPEDRMFVESMVSLCRGLGILTVAEFVENEAVTRAILELGIDYGQGWHFGKPLPDAGAQTQAFTARRMQDWLTEEGAARGVEAVKGVSKKAPASKAKAKPVKVAKKPAAKRPKATA